MKFKLIALTTAVALTSFAYTGQGRQNIVNTAMSSNDYSHLVEHVKAAGLVDTLKSRGPWTVFAPSQAAFEAVPDETRQMLMNDKKMLKNVLLYHVVPGRHSASEVMKWNGKTAITAFKTEDGMKEALRITVKGKTVMVNDAKVIKSITCSNGVIHVIDKVMMPPMMNSYQ